MIDLLQKSHQNFDQIDFIGSPKSIAMMQANGLEFKYYKTPAFIDKLPIYLGYPLRMFWGFLLILQLRGKVDFIYSTSDFFPDVIPSFLTTKIFRGSKWIQCVMHIVPHYSKRKGLAVINMLSYWAQQLSLRIARGADSVIVINNVVKSELIKKYNFKESNIFLITPGVDSSLYKEFRQDRVQNLTAHCYRFDCVYMGRFNEHKGVFDLPIIWAEVIRKNPSAKLAVIGSGNKYQLKKMHSLLDELKLSKNVTLFGFIDKNQCVSILQSSKLFIFPSYEEGFGLVLLEAFLNGNLVISWELPHIKETFEGVVMTVPTGNISEMARTIIHTLDDINLYPKKYEKIEALLRKYDLKIISQRFYALMN